MLKTLKIHFFILGSMVGILTFLIMAREEKTATKPIRSVTTLRLKESKPVDKVAVTGRVEAWKEENLSFEVDGKIEWVIDREVTVLGDKNPYSLLGDQGILVAKLESKEYEIRLKAAQANLQNTKAQLKALRLSVQQVISQQLKSAKVDLDTAEREFRRSETLTNKNLQSKVLYDEAKSTLLKSQLRHNEIKALINVRQEEIKAMVANIERLTQEVANTKLDLERTNLRVPYSGQITEIYANVGAHVNAGDPVVKLVAVNPISVRLNISPVLDRKLHFRQFVMVYPPGSEEPIRAMINRKSTTANPKTNTFSLELLVRNQEINVTSHIPKTLQNLPQINSAWPLGDISWQGQEKKIILTRCIEKDEQGHFFWQATEEEDSLEGVSVYKLQKTYLSLLPGQYSVFGVYSYKIIENSEDFEDYLLAAEGVSEVSENYRVVHIHKQRVFRPGDLVKVILSQNQVVKGIYIPLKIVASDSLRHWVFKAEQQPDGSSIVHKVPIQIKNRFHDQVLIESPTLKQGDLLILDGVHFISDQEQVYIKSIK